MLQIDSRLSQIPRKSSTTHVKSTAMTSDPDIDVNFAALADLLNAADTAEQPTIVPPEPPTTGAIRTKRAPIELPPPAIPQAPDSAPITVEERL